MKKLPLGYQSLVQIIENECIYVDKTELIYQLIELKGYFFLARPKGFGKSLLINTLRHIFEGNKELFKDLWIYDKIDWKTHPVIHLDFSSIDYKKLGLAETIKKELEQIANQYELILKKNTVREKFVELITKLEANYGQVAILVDEYDKPLVDCILDHSKAKENRQILRDFYGILKYLGDKLSILFITGNSKPFRTPFSSALDNLTDLTLHPQFVNLTGITQNELLHYFDEYITATHQHMGISREQLLIKIKRWYDGYSWDGKNFVYNPFSLLSFFQQQIFRNFWFATATPTFLVKKIRGYGKPIESVEEHTVSDEFFDQFELDSMDIYPLLFQTGYTTVKKIKMRGVIPRYVLGYPNNEVRRSFVHNLLEAYSFQQTTTVNTAVLKIEDALYEKDIELLVEQLNVLFADISYHLFPRKKSSKKQLEEEALQKEFLAWEGYFHTIIYLVLQFVGVYIDCEVTKRKGRLDAIVQTEDYLYIMEFKLDSVEAALQQIKDGGYVDSYRNSPKEVLLVGIAFDREKKEVKKAIVETLL